MEASIAELFALPLRSVPLPFVFLVSIASIVNGFLFRFYQPRSEGVGPRGWLSSLEFSPGMLGGFSYGRLALVSVLSLFLELLMIRWISSEIRMFAYFKNFVLIACFLGFGLGCYMSRRRINLLAGLLPLLTLVVLVKLPWKGLRELVGRLPSFLGMFSEMSFWSVPSRSLSPFSLAVLAAAAIVVVLVFALITFLFIPLGQLVGWYIENAKKGIFGYSVNILGSLAGITLYTVLCFLYLPPSVWLLAAGLMLTVFLWRMARLRWLSVAVFGASVGLAMLGPGGDSHVYWSPYQKLTITPIRKANEIISYELNTNDDRYQQIFDLSPRFVAGHGDLFKEVNIEWNAYNLPYRFYAHPPAVLILGAGTGNDAAAAIRNGADRVVAVEIDPLILRLGRQLHFERPYESPRVTQVLDDARSYLQNSDEQFDLILFSLLDSHTTSSHFTNIRTDNYVYTLEALQAAKRHLRSDGLLIVKFWVATPWIAGRLYGLLERVFGQPPLQVQADRPFYTTPGRFFVCGSPQRIAQAMLNPRLAAYVEAHRQFTMQAATLTTDDWPYFYQHEPGLPATVTLISGVLILLCWIFMRGTRTTGRFVRWHFFFLGAGFLLLEAQIVSKMALLFGTTWAVNAVVIGGLLLVIIASNILVEHRPDLPIGIGYAGIFLAILLAYLIPLQSFFFRSLLSKLLIATTVSCLPVFFAGIVFIKSFAKDSFCGEALGSNLLGALVGGLLESLSYWTGIRSLLVLAALLYLASWVALRRTEPVTTPIAVEPTH